MAYRRMYRCFFTMDNRTLVGREDDAQPRRASRGTDRRHDTEVNRLWQYWSHPLRRIARKQLGFHNLFFWECDQFALSRRQRILENTHARLGGFGVRHGFGHRRSLQAPRFMSALQ